MGDIWLDQIDQSKGLVTNSLWLQVHGHQGPTVGLGDLERVLCFVTCRYIYHVMIMGLCSNILIISILSSSFRRYVATVKMAHHLQYSDDSNGDDSHSHELLTVVSNAH